MANLTKNIGTVTLTGAAEKVTLPAVYGWVWVKNMSEGNIFAGLSEDISEGADGVMVIPSGECGRVQADGFRSVWLLGTGNVLVVAQNYADCPFKSGGKGGGDDWTYIGEVSISNTTEFSIPNLSNYKFMMLSICIGVYPNDAKNYTRIFALDDYKPVSNWIGPAYYIGNDYSTTSSSDTVYPYVGYMNINKSTNKVIFYCQKVFYANIYMK